MILQLCAQAGEVRSARPTVPAPPDLAAYRGHTVSLLRRYYRFSLEVGRLPSLLGREFFRTRVVVYHVRSFEDTVIFVHDVERCLEKLDAFDQKLIARIVLQDYSQEEAAVLLRCSRRTAYRRFPQALDQLSEIFLDAGLLQPLPCEPQSTSASEDEERTCQGGECRDFPAT